MCDIYNIEDAARNRELNNHLDRTTFTDMEEIEFEAIKGDKLAELVDDCITDITSDVLIDAMLDLGDEWLDLMSCPLEDDDSIVELQYLASKFKTFRNKVEKALENSFEDKAFERALEDFNEHD